MVQETPKELIFDIEANGLRPSRVHCWSVEGGGHGTDPASFQKEVLNKLSKEILAGKVSTNSIILLDEFDNELVFRNQGDLVVEEI